MTFTIHLRKSVKEAWSLFMKAPEILIVTTLAYFICVSVAGKIPYIGALINYLMQILIAPAFFLFADQAAREGKIEFSELKKLQSFLPNLLVLTIASFVLILIGFCLLIFPGIYLMVSYWFASLLVLFQGKNFWDAMEASRKLASKNWFGVWGFATAVFFLAISGILLLGVGLLATLPIASFTMYTCFRDIEKQLQQETPVTL